MYNQPSRQKKYIAARVRCALVLAAASYSSAENQGSDRKSGEELPLTASQTSMTTQLFPVPGTDVVLAVTNDSIQHWDFSRWKRYLEFANTLPQTRAALLSNPADPAALRTSGYPFRRDRLEDSLRHQLGRVRH